VRLDVFADSSDSCASCMLGCHGY